MHIFKEGFGILHRHHRIPEFLCSVGFSYREATAVSAVTYQIKPLLTNRGATYVMAVEVWVKRSGHPRPRNQGKATLPAEHLPRV